MTNEFVSPVPKRLQRQKNQGWDECDDIATAILALIRAQNMLQSLYTAECYVDVRKEKYKKAYAAREEAMLQLIAARDAFKREQAVEAQQHRLAQKRARRRQIRLVTKDGKSVE